MRTLFLAATLLLCASCAYFNTFYNARASYDAAVRSVAANPDNPSAQEEQALRTAIEGAGKVLSFYPGSKWADDAQLLVGDALLLLGRRSLTGSGTSDFEEAMRAYASAMIMTDDLRLRDRASLGMGLAAMELGRWQDAAAALETVTREDRDVYVTARISLSAALRMEGRSSEALGVLDSLAAIRMSDSLRGEVMLERGSTLLSAGFPDSAAAMSLAAAAVFHRGNGFYRALTGAADALVEAGRPSEAASALEPLLSTYRSNREMASISFLQGRAHEAAGEVDEALASYRNSADLDPSGESGAEALYRRAFLEEDRRTLQEALSDLRELSRRPGGFMWIRLASDRAADLGLLTTYLDSIGTVQGEEAQLLRFLAAEKRIDLYGFDGAVVSELSELSRAAGARTRALALAELADLPGIGRDSSRALLLEARTLADSGDLATTIEARLGLPPGPSAASRPSAVLERAWVLFEAGEFSESWSAASGALESEWSLDARPELLWAAYSAAEAAQMDDDMVESYLEELAAHFPGTPEGASATVRLGGASGDGEGGGDGGE